jgi:chemotaxis protein histidine kinase CheA
VIVKPFDPMTLAHTVQALWDRHYRHIAADERSQLAELEQMYLAQLPSRLADIERAARRVAEAGTRDDIETLFQLSHRLTGSSATLGFTRVCEAARVVESLVVRWRSQKTRPTAKARGGLRSLVDKLKAAASDAADCR